MINFQDFIDLLRGKKELKLVDSAITIRKKFHNNLLQQIKFKLRNNEKINVGFLVIFDSVFPAKPIFEQMLKDNRFNPFIVVIPDVLRGYENTQKQLRKTYNTFVNLYGEDVVLSSFDEETNKYIDFSSKMNLVCLANPYDAMTHKYYRIDYLSQYNLIFYVSYYYFGKLKYDLKFLKNKTLGKIWKIYIENKNSQDLFIKHLKMSKKNVIISGYPKMDEYKDCDEEPQEKTIIISPHHTVRWVPGHLNISNFIRLSDFYLRLPSLYPNIKFIFRPHPLMFVVLAREDVWGEERVKTYIEKLKAIPNLEYQEGGEYLETFSKSSALIHDCGSFMAEYLYTKNPQCFILESKKVINREFLPFGKKILKNIYTAYSEQNIIDFIDNVVIKKNDYMKNSRIIYANSEIRCNYPHSTMFILDDLIKEITK